MATQTKKKRKSRKTRYTKQERRSREISGLIVIAISLFLLLCVFVPSAMRWTGQIGTLFTDVLFGGLGLGAYVLPLGLMGIGCWLIFGKYNHHATGRTVMQVVLAVALMGFVHLLFWDRFSGDSYFANIMSAYQVCGAEHIGAGVVGTLFVYPLQKFIGVAGSYIAFLTLAAIAVVVIFNISLRDTGEEIHTQIKQHVDQHREKRKQQQLYIDEIRQQEAQEREQAVDMPIDREEPQLYDRDVFDGQQEPPRKKRWGFIDLEAEEYKPAKAKKREQEPAQPQSHLLRDEETDLQFTAMDSLQETPFVTEDGALTSEEKNAVLDQVYPPMETDWNAVIPPLERDVQPEYAQDEAEPAADSAWAAESPGAVQEAPWKEELWEPAVEPEAAAQTPDVPQNTRADDGEKAADMAFPHAGEEEQGPAPYRFPPLELLALPARRGNAMAQEQLQHQNAKLLEDTLASFDISAKVLSVNSGPAITRYELAPAPGIKVSRIVNLADDIALNMAATGVRIEAPIPGKAAIGIEVPKSDISTVCLRELLESEEFQHYPGKAAFALGKDIAGKTIVADIAKMPHLLIAGATGSGKSVCINTLIISLLYHSAPEDVKLIMVDPKVVELSVYNGIPHLLTPVVTDPKKAAGALNWALSEMTTRYKAFAKHGVRDLKGYNQYLLENGEEKLPTLVVIIDELADLMMVAPKDVEDSICRLAQMGRAAGVHLVIATQRPSVDIITGVIKANIPSRIAFAVSSQIDSRTILDMGGAEKLLGRGDMLYYPGSIPKPIRVQGAFVSDKEIGAIVDFIKAGLQEEPQYNPEIIEEFENAAPGLKGEDKDAGDELLPQAIELVLDCGQASISMLQRRLRIGYSRAGHLIDEMEARGIISGFDGSKARKLLITKEEYAALSGGEEPDFEEE
ncbi:DNA translocase FtsK [Christensenellaceae bacterium NSJ-44]|uniref:DNA translocase FtsK n=1 Tax=Luoshenia tenuis TaxID=2763654 RepID=A0A926D0A0_9FIRM|nr:DNA translocase FtsK [Luoshenia tenuis]MBC8529002.1 DNA translocase FtsK [Luoshenia tenuis]